MDAWYIDVHRDKEISATKMDVNQVGQAGKLKQDSQAYDVKTGWLIWHRGKDGRIEVKMSRGVGPLIYRNKNGQTFKEMKGKY